MSCNEKDETLNMSFRYTWFKEGEEWNSLFDQIHGVLPESLVNLLSLSLFATCFFVRVASKKIPNFIIKNFTDTGSTSVPTPYINISKKIGNTEYIDLVWGDVSGLPPFQPTASFTDIGGTQGGSCHTTKDKDKRTHR